MERLAIITSHPIQYNAPLFKLLASQPGLEVKVFYTLGKSYAALKDRGFGKVIAWDVPLLEGYNFQFLENVSKNPGTSNRKGVVNPDIIRAIEVFSPTAIIVYGWNFNSHLKVLRYFKSKVPLYFRGDSTLLNESFGLKKCLRRLALTWVYRHIDKALYVGANNKQYYLKHGVKDSNLVFAPHAIDYNRFGNDTLYNQKARIIREKLGVSEANILFAFIGKFEEVKNPLLLLRAFKRLNTTDVSLLFVGNGLLEEELKKKAEGDNNIFFLPFQNQEVIPAIYRVADVFVLPSVSETWGLAVNEAMACGLPVIVSDKVGCAIDLVKEKENGFIFKSGNLESITGKLTECVSMTKEELRLMGRTSRNIISEWSFNKACEAIVTALRKSS